MAIIRVTHPFILWCTKSDHCSGGSITSKLTAFDMVGKRE